MAKKRIEIEMDEEVAEFLKWYLDLKGYSLESFIIEHAKLIFRLSEDKEYDLIETEEPITVPEDLRKGLTKIESIQNNNVELSGWD